MTVSLVTLNGPQPGSVVPLDGGSQYTLGRDESCALPLDDPLASRLHARVWREGDRWRLEDCGSRNGTYVNTQPVDRIALQPGDLIRIGEMMVVFSSEESACQGLKPEHLADNTRVRRVFAEHRQSEVGAGDRSPRKLSRFFRLAKDLHGAADLQTLIDCVLESLREGIGADAAKLCLRDTDGRLKTYSAPNGGPRHDSHVLGAWIIQRNEALLIELNENLAPRGEGDQIEQGTAIGAPVPGRPAPRAALECFHPSQQRPFDLADLEYVISVAQLMGVAWENLEHRQQIEQANKQLRSRLAHSPTRILGDSEPLRRLMQQIARVAPADSTVLAVGESGTGKELVAQKIHELSRRAAGPFVAVNCAAYSDSLLESELFGHEKGAFTGADARRKGQFERAHRGTIFLDEVGELSGSCQAKLLRLLEGQPFERLGGAEPIQVDVRIVAATHRNLPEMARQQQFREDLWYRLRVIELRTPPLRERGEDIVLLASHFLERYRRELGRGPRCFSAAAVQALRQYSWPGNIRELKNAVERAVVLGAGEQVDPANLGLANSEPSVSRNAATLAENERRHIEQVLAMVGGNKTEACRVLGIGRATLYSKLSRMGG